MEKKTENGDLEKHAFLHHNPTPAIQYSKTAAETKRASQSACCGNKCCCCTTSWKCCGIATAVILVIVGAIIGGGFLYLHVLKSRLTGTASSEDAAEWETLLTKGNADESVGSNTDLITGDYVLVSYDENYPELLKAYGIPSFIVPFILGSSETISLTRTGDSFKMVTKTDWKTSEYEFANGEEFQVPWGRKGGIMHSICNAPEPNKMVCISEEREKGWNIIDESSFSTGGMIRNRHFVTKDVRAKKFYQRKGSLVENDSFGMEGNLTVLGAGDEDSPFSDTSEDYVDPFADFETMDDDDEYETEDK